MVAFGAIEVQLPSIPSFYDVFYSFKSSSNWQFKVISGLNELLLHKHCAEDPVSCTGAVPVLTLATNTLFPSASLNWKGKFGNLVTGPPLREENLSASNWISIFNQLTRKATKQHCAYAQSHWSMLCLASCFTVETLSGLSAPLTKNRTENQKLGTHAHTHGNKTAWTCKCGRRWRKQFVSLLWARTPNG